MNVRLIICSAWTTENPARKKAPLMRGANGGERMKVIIEGDPKEIAALVLAVQERQSVTDAMMDEITRKLSEDLDQSAQVAFAHIRKSS